MPSTDSPEIWLVRGPSGRGREHPFSLHGGEERGNEWSRKESRPDSEAVANAGVLGAGRPGPRVGSEGHRIRSGSHTPARRTACSLGRNRSKDRDWSTDTAEH